MKKHNKLLLLAVIAILCTDLVNYRIYIDNKMRSDFGYGASFFCTVVVGLIGYLAWKRYPVKWPAIIWLLGYVGYLIFFLIVFIISCYVHQLPLVVVNFIHGIKNFPIGPMPLLILYFLATYLPIANVAANVDTVKEG